MDDLGREFALLAERAAEGFQLSALRQPLVPEQENDLLETDLAGEFVDVVARVDKLALVTEHIAQAGGVGDDTFESSGDHGW